MKNRVLVVFMVFCLALVLGLNREASAKDDKVKIGVYGPLTGFIAEYGKHQEAGVKLADICRRYGISEPTFYSWKARFGGMDVNEARRLKQLEDENRRLKQVVADLTLDKAMLQDVVRRKW